MDYLQYLAKEGYEVIELPEEVLNLIINGLPSIHKLFSIILCISLISFKPYYKWITFNTKSDVILIGVNREF